MTDPALTPDAAALTVHSETRHHARHREQLREFENDVLFPQFENDVLFPQFEGRA